MSPIIAIVAPGAMGSAIGARLVANGARVLTTLDRRGDASRERAVAAGFEIVAHAELLTAALFLSIVPPARAVDVAQAFAADARNAATPPRFLDMNAVSPARAREVGAIVEASGATFVDGAIIGLPPTRDDVGPTLYLSGPVGDAADLLSSHGLVARTLDGGVGAASALKMSYAGITKGLTALASAMVLAADRNGAGDALRAELASSQAMLLKKFEGSFPDMLPKAWRWAPEMDEIADAIGDDRPEAAIYRAMAGHYETLAADAAGDGVAARTLREFARPRD